jgi:hypothetical protein
MEALFWVETRQAGRRLMRRNPACLAGERDSSPRRTCRLAHGFVDRAEDWEWSSFRTVSRLDPPPRPHLGCEPFERMIELTAGTDHLAVMRAYVRETAGETAMIAA